MANERNVKTSDTYVKSMHFPGLQEIPDSSNDQAKLSSI